ncbi:Hypothetical Protein FCC1311_111742 [Hondaea fermentalgiana]|uniref:Uncharacterized protein n=1 Tax=Hondaea fermentalgiana TaxID=2315210 RepID=A0A2R5H283_9STRA|nr:Hypothetical Protein FCC1311_111742 [Hondaea fermentalgiana]|eukprot:GBG34951.1 Hypothetical Protein FCC1311_111742 [Hondaea fermentalgiana]
MSRGRAPPTAPWYRQHEQEMEDSQEDGEALRLVEKARAIEARDHAESYTRALKYCDYALSQNPTCAEALMLAIELRLRYKFIMNPTEIIQALKKVTSHKSEGAKARYLLALVLLANGKTEYADKHLGKLGFVWRLNASVFTETSSSGTTMQEKVFYMDKLVPEEVLASIATQFGPDAPYWSAHRYGETGYFSHSFDLRAAPTIGAEALIANHIYPFLRKAILEPRGLVEKVRYAEWWVHRRDAMSGHQLHWDTDEHRLKTGRGLHHPIYSTVFYVEAGAGTPTLIMDRTYANAEDLASTQGWLVHPDENRLVVFDGQLLHGVVPRVGGASNGLTRLTFMVGFWGEDVARLPCNMSMPSANMLAPPPGVDSQWRKKMESWPTCAALEHRASPNMKSPPQFANVWKKIPQKISGSSQSKQEEDVTEFSGDFFLRNPTQLSKGIKFYVDPSFEVLKDLVTQAMDITDEQMEFLANSLVLRWDFRSPDGTYLYDEFMASLSNTSRGACALAKVLHGGGANEGTGNFRCINSSTAAGAAVLWNLAKRGFCVDPERDAAVWKTVGDLFEDFIAKAEKNPETLQGAEQGELLAGAMAYSPFRAPLIPQILRRLLLHVGEPLWAVDEGDEDGEVETEDWLEDDEEDELNGVSNHAEELREAIRHATSCKDLEESVQVDEALDTLSAEHAKSARDLLFIEAPIFSDVLLKFGQSLYD